MNRIKDLEQKRGELQEEFAELEQRAEEWMAKRDQRQAELDEAIINDDPTYKRTVRALEAQQHIEALGGRAGEIREELEAVEEELREAQYDAGVSALRKRREEVLDQIARTTHEFLKIAEEIYQEQVELVADFNGGVRDFNWEIAEVADSPKFDYITNFSSHDKNSWANTLLRTELLEGEADLVAPLPSENPVKAENRPLPSNRRRSTDTH